MPTDPPIYQRLPCKGGTSNFLYRATSTLWLAQDHLLLVTGNRFLERYRRFYLNEIQAITLRPLKSWYLHLAIALLITLLGPALAMLFPISDQEGQMAIYVIVGTISTVTFILFLRNLIPGPTCICHITTAVKTEELSAIKRLRAARRVLPRLSEAIVNAQQ